MARILVGIPCYDKVAPEVLEDYMRFAFYLGRRYPEHEFILGIKTKSEQFRARNSIVEGAYQMAADYLLMIDDDHIIDFEGVNYATEKYEFLRQLISHMEADKKLGLVGALYYHRGGQCKPVLLVAEKDGFRYLRDDEITGGLQEVDIQGGGIMLIRMTALDFVGSPWFEPETEFGTDFQICRKLKKAGFKIACDTSIEIGHLAHERKIITSYNRHLVQSDSTGLAKNVEISSRLLPIYQKFKSDVMEYLKLNDQGDLVRLAAESKEHRRKFKDYADKQDYYREAGKGYLARAAILARCDNGAWPSASDDFLLRTLRPGVPAIGVDFGCGAGRLSFEFSRCGHLMYYLDLDGVETFEFLKWRVNKHNLVAVFNQWPGDNSADYALANDIFEHLEDWQVLENIYRCLKPGGVLLSNYLLMRDWDNPEHINNDKPGFLTTCRDLKFSTVNSCVFQKLEAS